MRFYIPLIRPINFSSFQDLISHAQLTIHTLAEEASHMNFFKTFVSHVF